MPDIHEDIRRRLFDAAWETPAYAPVPERTVARARRRAALTIGGGAMLLAAVALAIFALAGSPRPIHRDRTARDVHDADPHESLVDTTTGDRSEFRALPEGAWLYDISPDGSRIAFTTDTSGRSQVWIVGLDGTGLRQLTHDRYEAIDPEWSPDGTRLVYVGFGGGESRDLFVIDVEGGKPHKVMTEHEDPWNPRWSPDGSRILYWASTETDAPSGLPSTTNSLEVRSVAVATGRVSVLAGGGNHRGAWEGAWDEASGRIAFVAARFTFGSGHADHSLWLMDDDGSRKEQLLSFGDVDNVSDIAWSPDGSQIGFVVFEHGDFLVHVFDLANGEDRQVSTGRYLAWVDDDTLLVQEFLPAQSSSR
jgi:dipeptidyl aminopeptidase/acylaminoacyl peptidase